MCIPLPFQIIELLPDERALVRLAEFTETVTVEDIDDPQIGDFVILHGKVALTKIDPDEARDMLAEIVASADPTARADCSVP